PSFPPEHRQPQCPNTTRAHLQCVTSFYTRQVARSIAKPFGLASRLDPKGLREAVHHGRCANGIVNGALRHVIQVNPILRRTSLLWRESTQSPPRFDHAHHSRASGAPAVRAPATALDSRRCAADAVREVCPGSRSLAAECDGH